MLVAVTVKARIPGLKESVFQKATHMYDLNGTDSLNVLKGVLKRVFHSQGIHFYEKMEGGVYLNPIDLDRECKTLPANEHKSRFIWAKLV